MRKRAEGFKKKPYLAAKTGLMDRVFKSKVDWWFYLLVLIMAGIAIHALLNTNTTLIIMSLLANALCVHVLMDTWYRVTADGLLIVHCSIFPEKKIAIAEIEALELTINPVSSYALSLDRIMIWTADKPWVLVSPKEKKEFVQLLRKINPRISIKN